MFELLLSRARSGWCQGRSLDERRRGVLSVRWSNGQRENAPSSPLPGNKAARSFFTEDEPVKKPRLLKEKVYVPRFAWMIGLLAFCFIFAVGVITVCGWVL
jgi:hypothetical protein